MLLPKRVKHRKWHQLRRQGKGVASRLVTIAYGTYALRSDSYGWITSRQIEAARKVLTRFVKKGGRIWIRIFPDRPITKKSNEVPMGGGKGTPEQFVCTIKPGSVLFEMEGIAESSAKEALESAGFKLPVKTTFIKSE